MKSTGWAKKRIVLIARKDIAARMRNEEEDMMLEKIRKWIHRDCVRRAQKAKDLLPLHCTSCGSQLTREDLYYDNCGVCAALPMPLEWMAAGAVE